METPSNNNNSKRRRSRKADGKYEGGNEAWEATDITDEVGSKEISYEVRPKVDGTSNPTAGKYNKKSNKVRPTFGNVTSITH